MTYQPEPFLGDLEDIPEYLQRQLSLLSAELEGGVDVVQLPERYEEPLKPRLGMIVLADGSVWDPGDGAGFYGFDGLWHFLGGGGGGGVLAQAAPRVSHTGDVNETTMAVVSNPAGLVGPTGSLEVHALWSCSPTSDAKTFRLRLGASGSSTAHAGIEYENVAFAETASYKSFRQIFNLNSEASQIGMAAGISGGVGNSPYVVVTSAIDMALDTELELSVQLANASDSAVLEAYLVKWVLS
jgi:hypothetical protein